MTTVLLASDTFPTKSVPDGIPDVPTVLLGSLGTARSMWRPQIDALTTIGPVHAFDLRGHGASQVYDGETSMSDLAADVVRALDLADIGKAHIVGLSIGGAVAQQIALDHPERVDRLALTCTAPKFGDAEKWSTRIATARAEGTEALVDGVLEAWFTADWAAAHPDVIANIRKNFVDTDRAGYARCCEALSGFDAREKLGRISAPTLVLAAERDGSTPPEVVRALADGIPNASWVRLDGGAHLCNIERAAEYNAALVEFLRP